MFTIVVTKKRTTFIGCKNRKKWFIEEAFLVVAEN